MKALIALAALTLLTACATLSEEECRVGNWATIGFEDGAQGRLPDFISQHREACAEFGIAPNLNAYLAGRDQGLVQYCTPQRAYDLGRARRPVANVCPALQQQNLSAANARGREYRRLSDEISQLEREIDEYEDAQVQLDANGNTVVNRSLSSSIGLARLQIQQLRARRVQYASWR